MESPLTWNDLVLLEPRLRDLEEEICAITPKHVSQRQWENECRVAESEPRRTYCANRTWYENYKGRLPLLSRYFRPGTSVLSTARAFDIATSYLYGIIPPCERDNCPCCKGLVQAYPACQTAEGVHGKSATRSFCYPYIIPKIECPPKDVIAHSDPWGLVEFIRIEGHCFVLTP